MSSVERSNLAAIFAAAVISIAYGACCLQDSAWAPVPPLSRAEFDVRPLLELGYPPATIKALVMDWTSGPWMEFDGDGGRIDLEGHKLVLLSARRNHTECEQVLKWLESPEEITFDDPKVARAVAALDRPVSLDLVDAPLWQVFQELGMAIGYPFCIYNENQGWPNPNERVQVSVVGKRAWDVCRDLPSGYDPHEDHIGAVYLCMPRSYGMKLQIDGATSNSREATLALASQLQESTPGAWEDFDGDGGRIRVPKPGIILLTAPFAQLMDARDAWRRLSETAK